MKGQGERNEKKREGVESAVWLFSIDSVVVGVLKVHLPYFPLSCYLYLRVCEVRGE